MKDIVSEVLADRQDKAVDALLATLRHIAENFEEDVLFIPDDHYFPDDQYRLSAEEHADLAFEAGKRRGAWLAGEAAESALDEWEIFKATTP